MEITLCIILATLVIIAGALRLQPAALRVPVREPETIGGLATIAEMELARRWWS